MYLRSKWRGRTRLTTLLATYLPSLQTVPIAVGPRILYVDLRDLMAHELFRNAPYQQELWEPDEQAVMRRVVRTGEVAFDIGAHFGEHAVLLSELVGPGGRVCAFEANPERMPALRRTVQSLVGASVHPYALTDQTGPSTLFVPELHSCASLSDWTEGKSGPTRQLTCEQRRLDDLVKEEKLPRPDFLKCDVEGAELLAFRGAVEVLNRPDAPIVLFERNRKATRAFGFSVSAPSEFLVQLPRPDYALYQIEAGGALVATTADAPYSKVSNLLAVPRTRLDRIERAAPNVTASPRSLNRRPSNPDSTSGSDSD
jgi:FkbM family methyltransferase